MTTYVALLRGINVGGKNIIKMDNLRREFEAAGFESVKTFIQSGNIIFQSDITDKYVIEKKVEKMLSSKFVYKAKVLIRSKKDMQNTLAHVPKIFEDTEWKHNVIFLSSSIDSKSVLKKLPIKPEIEEQTYYKGVLFWSANITKISRSNMLKLSTRMEYKEMTVRNINTTRKILELMNI